MVRGLGMTVVPLGKIQDDSCAADFMGTDIYEIIELKSAFFSLFPMRIVRILFEICDGYPCATGALFAAESSTTLRRLVVAQA